MIFKLVTIFTHILLLSSICFAGMGSIETDGPVYISNNSSFHSKDLELARNITIFLVVEEKYIDQTRLPENEVDKDYETCFAIHRNTYAFSGSSKDLKTKFINWYTSKYPHESIKLFEDACIHYAPYTKNYCELNINLEKSTIELMVCETE